MKSHKLIIRLLIIEIFFLVQSGFANDTLRTSQRLAASLSEELMQLPPKLNRGWVSPKGSGFFKLAQNMIRSTKYFTPSGDVVDITTTSIYSSSFYGEYAISSKLTVIAYVPLFTRVTLNEIEFRPSGDKIAGDELNSIGDIDLGVKYGLIQNKPFVLSLGLTLGIPSGNNAGGETQLLQSGDGEFNQLLRLDAGYSVPSTNIYLGATLGFNNRTNDFSDEFRYGFEAGYTWNKHWLTILKIDGVSSFNNGDAAGTANGIFSNNTEFLAISPEIVYQMNDQWGLAGSAGFAAFGKRILAAPNFSLGIYKKISPSQK